MTGPAPWWGEQTLDDDTARSWRIGASQLTATRRTGEWWLEFVSGTDTDDRTLESAPMEPVAQRSASTRRYCGAPANQLTLRPVLADRPVVVRPEAPLHVLPGSSAVLHVSTVVWLSVEAGGRLWEAPLVRPSDTWFGPDTRSGELCYASRTRARRTPDGLAHPGRAITKIEIENRESTTVELQRLLLPTHQMAVYERDGQLWTDSVVIIRSGGASTDELELRPLDGPILTPPRDADDHTPIGRVLTALWSR
ncbi:MAG: hypothetical protein ACI9K2_003617 [Myxococcota bacterium]|jgi:hypothetical protein